MKVYRVITMHPKTEGKKGEKNFTADTAHEHFEVTAHTHHTDDGHSEVHFKGKMTLKDADYYKYVDKYGHHFSDKLSRHLVDEIVSPTDKISYSRMCDLIPQLSEKLDDGNTLNDLYYMANIIKARHTDVSVQSDAHAITLAIEYLNDPEKANGESFCDWMDAQARKENKVVWQDFI